MRLRIVLAAFALLSLDRVARAQTTGGAGCPDGTCPLGTVPAAVQQAAAAVGVPAPGAPEIDATGEAIGKHIVDGMAAANGPADLWYAHNFQRDRAADWKDDYWN